MPSPGLSTDELDAYADYLAQVFRSDTWRSPPDSKGITSEEDLGLTYHELFEAVKLCPTTRHRGPTGLWQKSLSWGDRRWFGYISPVQSC